MTNSIAGHAIMNHLAINLTKLAQDYCLIVLVCRLCVCNAWVQCVMYVYKIVCECECTLCLYACMYVCICAKQKYPRCKNGTRPIRSSPTYVRPK